LYTHRLLAMAEYLKLGLFESVQTNEWFHLKMKLYI